MNKLLDELITIKLDNFLYERPGRFPKVTPKQKIKWVKNIKREINSLLNDNGLFYDNVPDDVEIDEGGFK